MKIETKWILDTDSDGNDVIVIGTEAMEDGWAEIMRIPISEKYVKYMIDQWREEDPEGDYPDWEDCNSNEQQDIIESIIKMTCNSCRSAKKW